MRLDHAADHSENQPPLPGLSQLHHKEEEDEEDDTPSGGGKQPRERRKIEIRFIQDKSRRHITFSKRKAGIMKKAYELSVLTGTQVLLLVVSETGLVYTFTTPKLQPLVTKAEGKNLIQACLNAPDDEDDLNDQAQSPPQVPSPQQAPPPPQPVSHPGTFPPTQSQQGMPQYQPNYLPDSAVYQPFYGNQSGNF